MPKWLRHIIVIALLTVGLIAPKVSALALHWNPDIMEVVLCTGTEMVTIHIDAEGNPVEITETEQAPCVLADPEDVGQQTYVQWAQAPRSYRASFLENANSLRTEAEVGLLPDLRGPPFVI